ncbi:nucleotidyltransferase domain-containing protein [Pseudonocardia sp. KRD-169]|uniref:Nucleotidyltransferase domain-containing protein n=2 Tax=Pseudonocardia abyssalis TaxID=2792008 RepID=A0ABS6UXS8_9PSEU|nr:nucleotidyltransferase domain-containing protein [Pseudonocardia abyssalis]MBW0136678.1 nucleotidyltransferase domain-containing protein [Pseudonocardia abyssalis]
MTPDHLRHLGTAVLTVAARRGAGHVRVLGSVARGEAVEGSDLDVLVRFEAGRSLLDRDRHTLDEAVRI